MAEIRLLKLRKEFRGTVAVEDLDLDIKEGEFLVLVGPSGCGKTTTLRMIAGLEEPTSGEILIEGRSANDLEPGQRNIGMVFQNLALFPHKTVYDNIAFGLRMKHVPAAETRTRVEQVARAMHIDHLLAKLPAQCRGGEAQRVALARTLVTNPGAFLLDEPLSNLDAKLRKEMRAEIDALHSRLGKTFVYVTHDQEEAMTLADRIVVMRGGRIEQVGTPMEIYYEPANLFGASFFGSPAMNLIAGDVRRKPDGPVFVFAGASAPCSNGCFAPAGWDGPSRHEPVLCCSPHVGSVERSAVERSACGLSGTLLRFRCAQGAHEGPGKAVRIRRDPVTVIGDETRECHWR